jgi:hypothetical protein
MTDGVIHVPQVDTVLILGVSLSRGVRARIAEIVRPEAQYGCS